MKKIFIPVFLFSLCSIAQVKDSVDLSNPNATIYTHIYYLQQDSYQPKKSAKTIHGLPEKEAITIAIKIKKVLDVGGCTGQVSVILLHEIPSITDITIMTTIILYYPNIKFVCCKIIYKGFRIVPIYNHL